MYRYIRFKKLKHPREGASVSYFDTSRGQIEHSTSHTGVVVGPGSHDCAGVQLESHRGRVLAFRRGVLDLLRYDGETGVMSTEETVNLRWGPRVTAPGALFPIREDLYVAVSNR